MINIGIVGSSFSSGNIRNPIPDKPHSKLLLDIFKEYNKNEVLDFYSLAIGGVGTETYLSNVIFLKQQYNIKILLIELIENREECNIKIRPKEEICRALFAKSNKNKFLELYKEYPLSLRKHIGTSNLCKDNSYNNGLRDEIIFLTIHDILQTINLCKLLDIKPIIWCYSCNDPILKFVKNLKISIEKFDNFEQVYNRFFKKYKGKEELFIYDNQMHLNNNANIELVTDFLLPEIYELT